MIFTAEQMARYEAYIKRTGAMQELINQIARCSLSTEIKPHELGDGDATLDYFITKARKLEYSENGE